MSQFYAEIQGNRGLASRQGSKSSGIWGHIRGWNIGALVTCDHIDGRDVVRVYRTSGSNGGENDELIAEFTKGEDKA
jgi:hypothetical protein